MKEFITFYSFLVTILFLFRNSVRQVGFPYIEKTGKFMDADLYRSELVEEKDDEVKSPLTVIYF